MADHDHILGCYWTLAVGADPFGIQHCTEDFRRRVEVASSAGYTGMGFWEADIKYQVQFRSIAEMKKILDDNGIAHIEVEWLNDWYYKDERRKKSDESREFLLFAAEALGADHIKVADLANDGVPIDVMIEEFARLCSEGAERGTKVLFEMLPPEFSRLPSLESALSLTRAAGMANGGVMIDNLHVVRTGATNETISELLKPTDLIGVEINDGYLTRPVKLDFTDTVVNKRLLPGDGEFDIVGFLHAVWGAGFNGPIGVEVINEYIRKWPLETAAQESFKKTSAVVAEARESSRELKKNPVTH